MTQRTDKRGQSQTKKEEGKSQKRVRGRGFAPLSSEWGSDKLTTTPTTLQWVDVEKDLLNDTQRSAVC